MSSLVYRDSAGNYFIGPLTQTQYQVLNDSLELASAWADRDVNKIVAKALRNLIPEVEDVERRESSNQSGELFNKLPNPSDD